MLRPDDETNSLLHKNPPTKRQGTNKKRTAKKQKSKCLVLNWHQFIFNEFETLPLEG